MKINNKPLLYWSVTIIVAVIIIYSMVNNVSKVPIQVENPETLSRDHIEDISDFTYNSNPPTSGDHLEDPAEAGFYTEQVGDGNLIHSLEHGYIIINYDCSGIESDCNELKNNIKAIVDDYPWKVIGNPRPENDHLISVTAWSLVMHLDTFDRDKIITFLNKYRNKAPEKTEN